MSQSKTGHAVCCAMLRPNRQQPQKISINTATFNDALGLNAFSTAAWRRLWRPVARLFGCACWGFRTAAAGGPLSRSFSWIFESTIDPEPGCPRSLSTGWLPRVKLLRASICTCVGLLGDEAPGSANGLPETGLSLVKWLQKKARPCPSVALASTSLGQVPKTSNGADPKSASRPTVLSWRALLPLGGEAKWHSPWRPCRFSSAAAPDLEAWGRRLRQASNTREMLWAK